jgi:asparagine synthase (glutamine-hydrolysing)
VMFSGGIDSTLVAFLAKKFAPTKLYTVGAAGCQDISWAKKISGEIQGELEVIELSEENIIEACKEVKGILKTENLLEMELAIPVFICAKKAKQDGLRVILSGHGADELFGGYGKYPGMFKQGQDIQGRMQSDLKIALERDVPSDNEVAGKFGAKVAFPFLSKKAIESAGKIPIEQHFTGEERKPVLREVARLLGVADSARGRPKKALQYGTGIHKVLVNEVNKPNHKHRL